MRLNFYKYIALFLFIYIASPLHAATVWEQTKTSINNTNYNANSPEGLWIFLGSNIGLVDVDVNSKAGDEDGSQINFKGLASLYKPESFLIYDLGLGFQSNRTSNSNFTTNTRSFFIDASARYEFKEHWSAGPVMNVLLGNKNSFSGANKTLATFLGATGHYEKALSNQWILRVGARFLTDLDVSSRRVNQWLLDLQIGFPPTKGSSSVDEYAFEDAGFDDDELVVEEITPVVNQPLVKIKIDDLNYSVGQVTPKFKDEFYLKRLAAALTAHQDLFSKVTVTGHAADFPKNKKIKNVNKIISHSRSKDVLKRLATNGLPSSKIFSLAFSEYKPSQTTANNNENLRKVELEFSGVTDEAKLREIISKVK